MRPSFRHVAWAIPSRTGLGLRSTVGTEARARRGGNAFPRCIVVFPPKQVFTTRIHPEREWLGGPTCLLQYPYLHTSGTRIWVGKEVFGFSVLKAAVLDSLKLLSLDLQRSGVEWNRMEWGHHQALDDVMTGSPMEQQSGERKLVSWKITETWFNDTILLSIINILIN